MGNCSRSSKTSCDSSQSSCSTDSSCMFSNSRSLSFFIPFVAVTFIYHFFPSGNAVQGNLVTELLPGFLAGLTSLAIYSTIKALKKRTPEVASSQARETNYKDKPITVEHLEKAGSAASNELKNLENESESIPLGPLGKREN
jgi:hypothetical protein